MKAHIHNRSVLNNLEQFSTLIHSQYKGIFKKSRERERTYQGFINRATGDLLFPENVEKPEELGAEEWKKVYLRLDISRVEGAHGFEVVEEAVQEVFNYTETTPIANHVMEQTIKILNFICQTVETRKDLEALLREIANLEIDYTEKEVHGDELIGQAWYEVDRLGAEKLLFNNVAGTYLFRKDLYAAILEQAFPIDCVTLTYLGSKGKIADITLIHKEGRWMTFNDDLTFSGPSYPNVISLVESLDTQLCLPLLNDREEK